MLLQDWLGYNKISGSFNSDIATLGHLPSLPTNRNLKVLLAEIFELQLQNVFATNVFPFIKPGGMSSKIPLADIFRAFKEFCYPQMEIIKPKLIICCGQDAYIAALNCSGKILNNPSKVCDSFQWNGALFYLQRHPGSRGMNASNYGGIESAKRDWLKMKDEFEQFKAQTT